LKPTPFSLVYNGSALKEERINMLGLTRFFGFGASFRRGCPMLGTPLESCFSEEISEYHGILLVRLNAGRALQVRLRESDVLTRTVPIAKATQFGEDPPWQLASAANVWAWIQSNAAIWQWLVAKGIDREATKKRLNEAMLPRRNAISV
jgi:hypothetical protein